MDTFVQEREIPKVRKGRKGINTWMKGRKFSEETKRKMSLARIGDKNVSKRPEVRKKISESKKGKKMVNHSGEKHWHWIKDRTQVKQYWTERNNPEYKQWRKQVWLRDNHECKIANPDCKGRIEAHHILSWRDYPELRYKINNGITLCHAHHPRKRKDEAELSPYFQKLVAEMK